MFSKRSHFNFENSVANIKQNFKNRKQIDVNGENMCLFLENRNVKLHNIWVLISD